GRAREMVSRGSLGKADALRDYQQSALDLSRSRRPWNVLHDDKLSGLFVGGDLAVAIPAEVLDGDMRTVFRDDEGRHYFTPILVGHASYGAVGYRRMSLEQRVHLCR